MADNPTAGNELTKPRPKIDLGEVISVGRQRCVIIRVRDPGDPFGDCEVVFNPAKPTTHDVVWTGAQWEFPARGDFGGYGDRDDLRSFVRILRNGPQR